jgi:hypothetical protein
MRLVSEDDVLALLTNHHFDNDKGNFDLLIHNLCKEVRRIPTAYDVDAVVKQLEMKIDNAEFDELLTINEKDAYVDAYRRAIEIVKGGGVE